MKTLRKSVLPIGVVMWVAMAAGQAGAESIAKTISRSGLTQEDVNIMTRAGASLYTGGTARVGDDAIWSNPGTNSHGMVEVTAVEGSCVTLAHRFRPANRTRTQTFESRRCLADGKWILSAP